MTKYMDIHFTLNGAPVEARIRSDTLLLDMLRDQFMLHSVRSGCENGECGACTVLIDNLAVNSCLYLAARVNGHNVTTLEGVSQNGKLTHVQQAFVDHGALQCGFCGSGMILSAMSLLSKNPQPSRQEVKEYLAGNLCRCSGYVKIENAVLDAAQRLLDDKHE